ncbi:MAG: nicotinate-nucleotide adenylyltransferase [Gammaproteobacteria bacterium]|nr:nicotinate-nucleotide adenylyltransferase [Gammaproteobacteria bacterium]
MIGIFGGTFDPVHNGHLITLEFVHRALSLECIFLIPLGQAVHREQPFANAEYRFEMLLLAVAHNRDFVVDDREIRKKAPSYTVDTLTSYRKEMPHLPIAFIVGSDAFNHFHEWHKPDRILELANLVVMQRPGHPIDNNETTLELLETHACSSHREFIQSPAGKILPLEVPQMDISSSDIRRQIHNGEDISEYVPEAVARLVRLHRLYSD